MNVLGWSLVVMSAPYLAACGCAASPERKTETVAAEPGRQEAWGASFALPPGWSGGETETGGYELTDGDLAVLVGRHALDPSQSLEAFADDRVRALRETGASESLDKSERSIGSSHAVVLRGRGTEGVEIRLLVARLGPESGISLLMVGDAKSTARIDAAWEKLIASLELPAH